MMAGRTGRSAYCETDKEREIEEWKETVEEEEGRNRWVSVWLEQEK
jgi:hypothetical protein